MTLPYESKDVIGKSQEIWNLLDIPHRLAADNAEGGSVRPPPPFW